MLAVGFAYQLALVLAAVAAAQALGLRPAGLTALLAFFPAVPSPRCCPSASRASACAKVRSCCSSARSACRTEQAIALGLLLYLLNLAVSLLGRPGVRGRRPRAGAPDRRHDDRVDADASGDRSPSSPPPGTRPRALRWWREVVYIVLVYVVYSAVRNQFGSGAGTSVDPEPGLPPRRGDHPARAQHAPLLRARLQHWYLDLPAHGLIRFWNVFYGTATSSSPPFALVWLYRQAPERYRVWRNTLAFTTLLALIGFAIFSLMPPRLLDDPGIYGGCQVYADDDRRPRGPTRPATPPCDGFGFVDTLADLRRLGVVRQRRDGGRVEPVRGDAEHAHRLVDVVRVRAGPADAAAVGCKALVIAYPLLTLFCILVTGNHYWIDAARRPRLPRRRLPLGPAARRPGGSTPSAPARPSADRRARVRSLRAG